MDVEGNGTTMRAQHRSQRDVTDCRRRHWHVRIAGCRDKNMELRLLRYFLTVAREQSFTRAAEQLHVTQPTLSRQMAAFEEELGISLFRRNGKKITLTDDGILLKRRALEILDLEERTMAELKRRDDVVEGNITISCGEFAAMETLAEICRIYKEKYPRVQIALHTATADAVAEMMN